MQLQQQDVTMDLLVDFLVGVYPTGENNIVIGTQQFIRRQGTACLAGAVKLSTFPEVYFDCIWVLDFF